MASTKPFHILLNQAVQIEVADPPSRICGVVTNFLTNQIVVRFPQHAQMPDGVVAGVPIIFRSADAAGLRVAKSEIVELCAPPRPGVVLRIPREFETVQKRRFFRVLVDIPCTVDVLEQDDAPASPSRDDKARILDISVGGARLTTSCPLRVGERLQLDFVPTVEPWRLAGGAGRGDAANKTTAALPAFRPGKPSAQQNPSATAAASPSSVQARAKVVRVVPPSNDEPDILQAGIEFEKLPICTEDRLMSLVFEVQRGRCRRSH